MLDGNVSDVKYVGRVSGRYTLPQHVSSSQVSVFACLTQGISSSVATICAPVNGKVGDTVSANFDHIGMVHGDISRLVEGGFTIQMDPRRNDMDSLGRRIAWLKKRKSLGITDNRAHKRFIPRTAITAIILPDGRILKCFIADMSVSGVALSMDYQPPVGTQLAVGSVVGRVVRHLDFGFAVKFAVVQKLESLVDLLYRLPEGVPNPVCSPAETHSDV